MRVLSAICNPNPPFPASREIFLMGSARGRRIRVPSTNTRLKRQRLKNQASQIQRRSQFFCFGGTLVVLAAVTGFVLRPKGNLVEGALTRSPLSHASAFRKTWRPPRVVLFAFLG